jgi:hypothetical protein
MTALGLKESHLLVGIRIVAKNTFEQHTEPTAAPLDQNLPLQIARDPTPLQDMTTAVFGIMRFKGRCAILGEPYET